MHQHTTEPPCTHSPCLCRPCLMSWYMPDAPGTVPPPKTNTDTLAADLRPQLFQPHLPRKPAAGLRHSEKTGTGEPSAWHPRRCPAQASRTPQTHGALADCPTTTHATNGQPCTARSFRCHGPWACLMSGNKRACSVNIKACATSYPQDPAEDVAGEHSCCVSPRRRRCRGKCRRGAAPRK